ncbi:MAG: hypothetical protein HN551_07945 [Tateyamaria sp.]|jgi:hypothetical protein|nr:hypothetical protein [Tateyamaria sp.]MBT6343685.1 hypothetical protein [Tateyamaria sp.]MBT7801159.1 hypothetical protein [Tateyamaria sp.]
MTIRITIPAEETGVLRVFSLSMNNQDAKQLKSSSTAIFKALGTNLDCNQVEILALADLGDIGLVGYLSEGCAIPSDQLDPDIIKLNSLSGWVLIIFSNAFKSAATTLKPAANLNLIGTYSQIKTDWRTAQTVTAESAKPFTAPPLTIKKKPSDAAMSGRIATLALIVMFALTGLIIWIAG